MYICIIIRYKYTIGAESPSAMATDALKVAAVRRLLHCFAASCSSLFLNFCFVL